MERTTGVLHPPAIFRPGAGVMVEIRRSSSFFFLGATSALTPSKRASTYV
jgi:hypothetical protein